MRCLLGSSPIYFTPKSSIVNVKQMVLFSFLKSPGVWSTSAYPCYSSCSLSNFFDRLPDSGSPYMPRMISQYTNPFFILSWSWYRSMNSWGINLMGIVIYWWRSSGVARYKLLQSPHIYLSPFMLITIFHIQLDVLRSDVRVVNSPGYVFLRRLPPAVILTRFGSFLWSIINTTKRTQNVWE